MTPTEIARAARKIAVDWVKNTYPDLKITDANPRYSDIVAMDNNGNEYCFEVKGTTKPTGSFGAATLTECEYAIKSIDRYWFLLVYIGGVLERTMLAFKALDLNYSSLYELVGENPDEIKKRGPSKFLKVVAFRTIGTIPSTPRGFLSVSG